MPEKRTQAGQPIQIELTSAKGARQPLSEPPELSVRVTNTSDEPVWMVGVLPGSEGMRYPRYEVEIEGPSGRAVPPFPEGMDYARGLQPADFKRLAPGESFDPQEGRQFIPIQQLAWFKPSRPGTYRFRVRLDTQEENPREWLGHTYVRDPDKVITMLRQVPKIQVESNILEIEFD
jgi:hypothetical protein